MSAFIALIFLNMGFFLMEVKALGLSKDLHLMESISRMMAGGAFEEERDAGQQSQAQNSGEEEYLPGHHPTSYSAAYFLIDEQPSAVLDDGSSEKGYFKNFCPPPEI